MNNYKKLFDLQTVVNFIVDAYQKIKLFHKDELESIAIKLDEMQKMTNSPKNPIQNLTTK